MITAFADVQGSFIENSPSQMGSQDSIGVDAHPLSRLTHYTRSVDETWVRALEQKHILLLEIPFFV